jgi:hypothetical protein
VRRHLPTGPGRVHGEWDEEIAVAEVPSLSPEEAKPGAKPADHGPCRITQGKSVVQTHSRPRSNARGIASDLR